MSKYKELIVNKDYFPGGMTADEFVEFVLSAKKNKKISIEELVNVESIIQKIENTDYKTRLWWECNTW